VTADPPALRIALAGRYTIERELGRGGMATVYLARDVKHDRPVALKVLRPELAASLGAERFLREIQVTAHLTHPNILPLLERFVRWWADCDPELRPFWEQGRDALARVTARSQ